MSKVIPDCEKRLVGVQSGQVGSGGQEDLWVEMHSEGDSLKTETAKICGKVHSKVLGRVPMLSSDSHRDAWPPNRRAHGLVTLSAFHFGAMVGGHK